MPTLSKHGKFIVDPNYDEEKDLSNSIAETRNFLRNELSEIDKIEDATLQLIVIFSLIDRLAQEQANYPSDFKKAFCEFILKHQKQCDYLEKVEPVTLYYHVEEFIEESELVPNFPPEKEISLDTLGNLYYVTVKSTLSKGKAKEILDYIEKKKGVDFAHKMIKEHQFISLIYRMRSKAVHEMSGLGETISRRNELCPKEPYYIDMSRMYVQGEDVVSDDVIELIIPNIFLRNILEDCIEGYLKDCAEDNRFPFSNNHITRKFRLSWYDK